MANIYLISDDYFKQQYPEYRSIDSEIFYSNLLIEQNTSLDDAVGETLNTWLLANANTVLTGDSLILLQKVQYLLVFLVARSVFDISGRLTDDFRDDKIKSLDSKVEYLKAKLKAFITSSTVIEAIVNGDATFNSAQTYSSPIVYWSDIQ